MHKDKGRIVESAVAARGGRLGRPVFVVLVTSIALLVLLYAAIYLGYFAA